MLFRGTATAAITLAEDAGWCWFQNPRAIISNGVLWAGYVCSGYQNPEIAGQIRVVEHHLDSAHTTEHILFQPSDREVASTWVDDHNAPSLIALPNGDILAAFTRHGRDEKVHFAQVSPRKGSATVSRWTWALPPESRVTYSNLVYLESEQRLFNFFRGLNGSWKPSLMVSDDWGRSWHGYSILVDVAEESRKQRPYILISSNGVDDIHFVFTDDHPRDSPNSLYYMKYESGKGLSDTDGKPLGDFATGISHPSKASVIHSGSPDAVAWPLQLSGSACGEQQVLYQLSNHRHRSGGEKESVIDYWFGVQKHHKWRKRFLARAGSQLYKGEDDYSGLAAMNPGSLRPRAIISTNKNPNSGRASTGWRLWRKAKWGLRWQPIRRSAAKNQHRPLILDAPDGPRILWLEGEMTSYRNFRYRLKMSRL